MFLPIQLTPNLIWKGHYGGDLSLAVSRAIKETVLKPSNMGSMRGGAKTNANHNEIDPHNWPELTDFMKWFYPNANKVWKEWDMLDFPLRVANSWTNVTNKGGFVAEHDHGSAFMSVAFYLEKPENSGNIEFRNVLHSSWASLPRSREDLSKQDYFQELPATTGDCLIFPAWLSHRVQPSNSDSKRIVMSMNLIGY